MSHCATSSPPNQRSRGVMPQRHARLAQYAKNRRMALRLKAREVAALAGLSKLTIGAVEAGRRVDELTLWKLDHGLGWEDGSSQRVLDGGEPTELPFDRERGLDPVELQLWNVKGLSEARRWQLIHAYRAWRDTPTQTDQNRSKTG